MTICAIILSMSDQRLSYEITPPKRVGKQDLNAIQHLRAEYYGRNLRLPSEATQSFIGRILESWDDPNLAPGHSRRARPRVILARDRTTQEVAGYAYVADDASSSRKIVGEAEKLAKLYVPVEKLIGARYLWFREIIPVPSTDEPSFATMAALALHPLYVKPEQPTRVYPWQGEDELEASLKALGYHDVTPDDYPQVPMFPGSEVMVDQLVYHADRAPIVYQAAMMVDGVAAAVRDTMRTSQ